MIELHPGTPDQNLTWNDRSWDLPRTWWKMIVFNPGTSNQNITSNFIFRFSLDMVKDDWSPPWYCRPGYHLKCFKFRFNLDMVKDEGTPPRYCRPEYHLKCFNFRFSLDMVKDHWTPPWYSRPEYHLKCFIFRFRLDIMKDDWPPSSTADQKLTSHFLHSHLACTWLKMIELHSQVLQTRISPKIFYCVQI